MSRRTLFRYSPALALLLLSAAVATPRAASEFRVVGAGLEADPTSYSGPCPGVIKFRGKIQASGAGRVKYTYSYSDGGGGPEGFVDFEGPGVKHVETSWRLGDARALPHYEGWAVLKIISPNEYESNRAKFVLDCTQPGGQTPPPGQPAGGAGDDFAQTYLNEVSRLSAAQRQKFTAELGRLKAFAEELRPKLAGAQKQSGFDAEALRRELRAIAEAGDEAKRDELGKAFEEKYEPRALEMFRAAGLDVQSEQKRLGASLPEPGNDPPRTVRLLAFIFPTTRSGSPPPAPPPPDVSEQVYRAPFTSQGTFGGRSTADRNSGRILVDVAVDFAGSEQRLAFITQNVAVGRGVRSVRASAALDPVQYYAGAIALLFGYSSAEAIVNLRVMEGSREMCSERVSLARAISAVAGFPHPSGTRPVTLQCGFTRAAPETPTTYHLVAELEGWAGAGGLAGAFVGMTGTLRQFEVLLDRR